MLAGDLHAARVGTGSGWWTVDDGRAARFKWQIHPSTGSRVQVLSLLQWCVRTTPTASMKEALVDSGRVFAAREAGFGFRLKQGKLASFRFIFLVVFSAPRVCQLNAKQAEFSLPRPSSPARPGP
jgi:hypothetical protein